MKPGIKPVGIGLLFVGLVLINYLAASLPFRVDATAEHIYTLSPGTRALLAKINEPIVIDYYFSQRTSDLRVEYKNYAERVREMLRQYVRAAHGKIALNVIDPEPDTPEEEKATAAGIDAQRLPGGEPFYFGVLATQADQQKAISSLTPDRERFLEYDLSQLIYSVQQADKKKLGLITSLPLQGSAPNPMTGDAGGQEGQYVVQEWSDSFDIVPIDSAATELPANLDALAVIHPENLSPKLQYAIDQFLLGGKPEFIAVDPSSQYFKRQGGQMAMFNGPPPNVSSDLPALFSGWGIDYNPQKIVGDNDDAVEVQLQDQSVVRYPVWLGLEQANFNAQALPTAELSSMLFVEAGSLSLKPGTSLNFVPLVQTSPKAGEVDAAAIQFAEPDAVARQIVPTGKKAIAALVTGKFKSAFPDGPPKDQPPAPGAVNATAPKPAARAKPGLKESVGTSNLLLVADTDWLFDDYSIRKVPVFGQTAVEPRNDNLAFAANSLDFLSGSQDLISIRGKGASLRPFAVVEQMEARANEKYEEKLTALEAQLNDVQTKITQLEGSKTQGNRLVASPEVERSIEDFRKQAARISAERRQIRLALREGIDALEYRLLAINMLATPLLVCAFGIWFHRSRRK